jgi:hypothetical protein
MRPSLFRARAGASCVVLSILCASAGCVGDVGGDEQRGDPGGPITDEAADEVGVSGMRRLAVSEYRTTVRDLVGVDATAAREILPADTLVPFDNDFTQQTASEALVKGVELLAGDIAGKVVGDPQLRAGVVGCEPTGPDDEACFRSFVERFGRRALRRPLTSEEVDRFTALRVHGVEASDFWAGVGAALRAFLQHPEFLYRVEMGTPVEGRPGVFELGPYEIATRLSYFLEGSAPPDWLLDAAESGSLSDAEGIAQAASQLLAGTRVRQRIQDFHAMWLSYQMLTHEGVPGMMHDETNALLDRVIFDERRPWVDVLTSPETFVTPELANHYGLAAPDGAGWVSYGESGRKGLLSHGTFLSAVPKFGDTSPTQRGLLVRTRLFCETIPKPPPELNVDVDMPPTVADADACKSERYFMAQEPTCQSCHRLTDPIGFGLEQYDAAGKFRTAEPNRPECAIDGEGEMIDVGTFNGPAGLADLVVASGEVEACVARQLYRFAVGRAALDAHDVALVDRVVGASSEDGLRLDAFILGYVTSDAFRYRREEEMQ